MAEIGISIAAKVAELLVDPIGRHISYAFKYQRNMEELKKQVKKLTNRRESVQNDVDEANGQGEEIKKEVQDWLDSVDEFVKEVFKSFIDDQVKVHKLTHETESVQHSVDEANKQGDEIEKQVQEWLISAVVKPITDDSVKTNKLCSTGFCPNPMTRYSLSKKAVKAVKDGVDLLGQGQFPKVHYRLPPRRTNSLIIKDYEDFASRMSLSERIMEALADTETDLIGVYGMGGVGKTTLVNKVAQQAKENKLFDVVVTAVVTETPDIIKIQGQIADELGLEFRQESESGRAGRLRERILKKENRILVILDNVWTKLDLKSIGIPVGGDAKGSITQKVHQVEGENANKKQCKILFTSRNLDVLRDMDTQENFKVEVLFDKEGESLFWKTVGRSQETSDLNPIAVEIVGKCGGLPVAIKTIANALKKKSLPSWKTARDQLKKANPKNIRGMDKYVYSTIELSFNLLENEEAKPLFLLCSLCNEGYGVHITNLLNYGMGLGLFPDVYTLEEGRNKLHSLIEDLKNSSMLMDHDYDSNCVKMHDVIHAVAVSIASTTKLWFDLQDAAGLKKLPKESVAVSLLYRDMYELPKKMEFPKLELFLLYSKYASLQIPDTVFEGMKGLKVLDISEVHLMSPPSFLRSLINLHTLCLDRCRLKDVAIICELKELEILSLLNSDIEQLPREIVQLTRLRSLCLSNCSKLKIIEPNVISSLTRLEELYMHDSFDQWDIDGQRNASLAELKQLSKLTALDIHVPNAQIIPQGLSFEKLERYRISIGEVWDWFDNCETSRALKLKLSSSIYLSNEIKSLMNRTEDVHLDLGSQEIVAEDEADGFMSLFSQNVVLPSLKNLKLSSINIRCTWLDQLPVISCCCRALTNLTLRGCNGFKFLFSYSVVQSLVQLQKLEVRNCKSIEEIIKTEELRGEKKMIKMEFPKLLDLQLKDLPELVRFGSGNSVEFLSLTQISIEDCPKLKTFFSGSKYADIKKSKEVEEMNFHDDIHLLFDEKVELPTLASLELSSIASQIIWHNQLQAHSACFHTLTMLTIDGFDNLKYLFPFSVAESLDHLEVLFIRNCKLMEGVIISQGERKSSTMFPKLKQLTLDDLLELTRFCNFNGNSIELPSLSKLIIENCPKMQTFASDSLPGIEETEEVNTKTEDNLPSFFDEKVSFSCLKELKLIELLGLLHLWKKNSQPRKVFENLAYLKVLRCSNLKTLVQSSVSLQNLETLEVRYCDGLISLVTFSTAKSLKQLKRMKIIDCKLIEEIIIDTGDEIKDGIVFNQLKYLKLDCLSNLTSFCKGNFTIEFPYLRRVLVIGCLKMMNFSQGVLSTPKLQSLQMTESINEWKWEFEEPEEVWEGEEDEGCWEGDLNTTIQKLFRDEVGLRYIENFTVSNFPHLKEVWHEKFLVSYFSNLKSLVVDDKCCSLRYIFTPSVALGLAQLQDLKIKNCVVLEVITVIGEETISNTMFPNLNSLELMDLPNLTCFSNFAGNSIELPSLTQLSIENCPNMETFISNFLGVDMSTSKENCHTDIEPLFDEKVGLPNLGFLQLGKMDKLRKIWHHQLNSDSFCKLDYFGVHNCHNVLNVIPSNMLGRLQKLDELRLINCSSLCEIFELRASDRGKTQAITLKKLELNDLPKLKHIWDVESQGLLTCQNLISIEVTGCGSLKSIFPASVGRNLLQLDKLWIDNCCMVEEIFAKEEQVDEVVPRFPRLTLLRLGELPRLRSFYPRVHISEWPMLKKLQIWKCDKVEVSASNFLSFQVTHEMPLDQPLLLLDKVPLTNLESLGLDWKWFEKEALHEKLPEYSCKLNFLTIEGFHKGADICVFCFLQKLPNLEKLQVAGGFFKGLFLCEGFGCDEKHVEAPSKLSHLRLIELNDSLHLWEENSLSSKGFQNLAILEVVCCSNLKSLVPSSVSFQNLTRLEVLECNELLNLVAVPTAKSLVQLTELSISECKMVEEIVMHEGDEVKDRIIFKKLRNLELKCLPSLTSFYPGSYTIVFPSLQQVFVSECPNMKIFSRGVLSTPRLHRLQTTEEVGKGFWKGNLNTTIEHLFIECSKEN